MRKYIATLLVVLLTLVGCTSLPTSGEVNVVARPTQQDGQINFDPQGPTPNAKPEEIVDGFMRASGAGPADDFSVARQYLTPEAASLWNPTAQVRIYPDNQNHNLSRTRSGAVRVSVPAYGSLDETGVYTVSSADAVISAEFSLLKDSNNQWRIAVLDDGVIMPDSLFRSLYQEIPLYFYTSDYRYMVPDVRWFPRSRSMSLAVSALATGPTSWLSGAVRSALPVGVELGSGGVTLENQTAVVDLSSEVTSLSDVELSRLRAQLAKTLVGTDQVQDVRITSAGAALEVTSAPDIASYPMESYPVTGIRNGEIVSVTRADGVESRIGGTQIQELQLTDVAPNYGSDPAWVAARGGENKNLYVIDAANGQADLLATDASGLTSPSTDRYGFIWSAPQTNAGEIFAFNATGQETMTLPLTGLDGTTIEQVRVSREGARLIVVAKVEGVPTIYALGIERNGAGDPVSLSEPRRIGMRLAVIGDLSWVDDRTLVVAGSVASGVEYNMYSVPIGGPMTGESFSNEIASLTSARGKESVVIETTSGTLYEYDAGAWRVLASDVASPAFPG